MEKHNYPGSFIAVEGLDGAGNSTQASNLASNLESNGYEVHLTKEPTDSLIGGLLRSRLRGEWETSPEALQLLFTADRAHHLFKEIIPLLKDGVFVVCDRYVLSTLAYGAIDMDLGWLLGLNKKFITPDVTFFVDVDPKKCVERIADDRQDFELFEKRKELSKVRKKYEKIIKKFDDIIVIDGEKDASSISEIIFSEVEDRFK